MKEILDRLKIIETEANEKASKSPSASAKTMAAAPAQIPLWPQNVRGIPNSLARSALFNVNKPSAARELYRKGKVIASSAGTSIMLKGEELRQDDADVLLEILHLARDTVLSERIEFTGYSMLKLLGWDTSSKGYERLVTTIDRLQQSTVAVKFEGGKKGFQGQLVRKFYWKDQEEGADGRTRWIVYVEPEIVHLFASDDYTRFARTQRIALRSEVAKWLHSYYHTHAVPFDHKVAFIHEQCGSKAKSLAHFRVTLKKALSELEAKGFLASWNIDPNSDLVHVDRARQQNFIGQQQSRIAA